MASSRQSCSKAWSRRDVQEDFEYAKKSAQRSGKPLIFPTQVKYGKRISEAFLSGKSLVCFVASPQFGKTATSLQCIVDMTTCADDSKIIHKDNVYVMTGMSDLDWKTQMTSRMLPCFSSNIFHRNDAHKMIEKTKNRSDILLILDECHIAFQNDQTLHELLVKSGIWDVAYMIRHNIKILCISATPAHVLMDISEWDSSLHSTIVAKPNLHTNDGYMSFRDMLDEGRVQSFDIRNRSDMEALVSMVERTYSTNKHHILRLKQNYRNEMGQVIVAAGYKVSDHNCTSRLDDVDTMLESAPSTHHFIIIKSLWRASKTLSDKHIGICMDNSTDFTCVAQGLAGRLLGYGRARKQNAPLLLTNVPAVKQYVAWLENGCDYHTCELYESNQLKIVQGSMKRKKVSSMHYCEIKHARSDVTTSSRVGRAPVIFNSIKLERLGAISKIADMEPEAKLSTAYTLMSLDSFKERFKLRVVPDSARGLRELMIRNGHDVTVAYKLSSATSDTNLKTYYAHQQAWSAARYHVIKLSEESDDGIVVIQRNVEMLNAVVKGNLIIAHNHARKLIKYRVI